MRKTRKIKELTSFTRYLRAVKEKFEEVMPEVNKKVRVYEEKRKARALTPVPSSSPLFSE